MEQIKITDVTLRDGLQSQPAIVETSKKVELAHRLFRCGYDRYEITSFVNPKWIPTLADAKAFCESLFSLPVTAEVMGFVPNQEGLDRLLEFPIPWVSCFVATSETFNRKNVNRSVAETVTALGGLVEKTHSEKRKIRIYLSTVFGCPYENEISVPRLMAILQELAALEPDEIALSDTIGVALPSQVTGILGAASKIFPKEKTALHFHNTYGLAIACIQAAYALGYRSFDGSTGGLGGCPYAKGASGNVASDEVLYYFAREKRAKLLKQPVGEALQYLSGELGLHLNSRLAEILGKGGTGMASNNLLIRRESGIVIATLNRPEKFNALNKDLFDDLKHLVDVLETDKTVRVLIFTGAGEKAFSGGADLKERQGMNEKDVLVRFEFVRALYQRLERLPIPTIAAINGLALGGGLELALTCDLRVAADNAMLGLPEVDLAIIPGNGGTQRLARLVGMGKALELVLLAKKLTASEALELEIVSSVTPQGQALTQALVWAHKMLEAGPIALKAAKYAIRGGLDRTLEQGLLHETEAYKACLYSKDRLEGLKAFVDKRKPVYRGE